MLIIDLILVRVLTMAVLFLHSSISLKRKLCRSTSPGMSTSESLLFKIGIFSFQGIPRFFEMAHETSRASLKCRFDGTYTQTVHAKLGPARSQSSRVLLTALDSDWGLVIDTRLCGSKLTQMTETCSLPYLIKWIRRWMWRTLHPQTSTPFLVEEHWKKLTDKEQISRCKDQRYILFVIDMTANTTPACAQGKGNVYWYSQSLRFCQNFSQILRCQVSKVGSTEMIGSGVPLATRFLRLSCLCRWSEKDGALAPADQSLYFCFSSAMTWSLSSRLNTFPMPVRGNSCMNLTPPRRSL